MILPLEKIKNYSKCYIQPHDFPDADALASAFALQEMIKDLTGVESDVIYFGPVINKPSLVTLVNTFGIKTTNYPKNCELELHDDELLICVDCHHFGSNVTKVFTEEVAYIDHHESNRFEINERAKAEEQGFSYKFEIVDKDAGSCSSIISRIAENHNYSFSKEVASALTVGIMKDTKQLTTNYQLIDHQGIGYLYPMRDNEKVNLVNRVNYTEEETKLVVELFSNMQVHGNIAISYLKDCPDNNTVGQLADLLCEVEGIKISVLYANRLDYYRFSVRSFDPVINPSSLISHITKGIGGGGGKKYEAAGSIDKYQFSQLYRGQDLKDYVVEKAVEYCTSVFTITSGIDNPFDMLGEDMFGYYRKKNYNVRYIRTNDLINPNETLTVRTKEGIVEANSNEVLILGVEGEIYPISEKLFEKLYDSGTDEMEIPICDGHLPQEGIYMKTKDREINLDFYFLMNTKIARYVNKDIIRATKLGFPFMVNVVGGTLTAPKGGYLAVRNLDDIYICDDKIFEITFKKLEKEVALGGIVNV